MHTFLALLAAIAYALLRSCGPATRITIRPRRPRMLTTQKLPLTATPNGTLTGAPQWTTSNPAVCEVVAAPDGLTAFAIARGAGTCTIFCTEPPRSDGTASAEGQIDVTVTGADGRATSITITVGDPVPQ